MPQVKGFNLGKTIYALRKKYNLPAQEISRRSGIMRHALANIEQGKIPGNLVHVARLAHAFGLEPLELLAMAAGKMELELTKEETQEIKALPPPEEKMREIKFKVHTTPEASPVRLVLEMGGDIGEVRDLGKQYGKDATVIGREFLRHLPSGTVDTLRGLLLDKQQCWQLQGW
jgi:transcriptional regulator with XRE-family HTH domain